MPRSLTALSLAGILFSGCICVVVAPPPTTGEGEGDGSDEGEGEDDGVPPTWTCPHSFYDNGSCDCGCGVIDDDCTNANFNSCAADGNRCLVPQVPAFHDNTRCVTCAAGPETSIVACSDECDNDTDGFVDCDDFTCTDSNRGATPEAIAFCGG